MPLHQRRRIAAPGFHARPPAGIACARLAVAG
jgi:hypothetical protein